MVESVQWQPPWVNLMPSAKDATLADANPGSKARPPPYGKEIAAGMGSMARQIKSENGAGQGHISYEGVCGSLSAIRATQSWGKWQAPA